MILAFHDARYNFLLVIPCISVGLLLLNSKTIFVKTGYCPRVGLPLALAGLALSVITAFSSNFSPDYALSTAILAVLLVWVGIFVWCYGALSAQKAIFPLAFLALMIPIPAAVLDHLVVALQRASADMSLPLFKLAGMPVVREGAFRFLLPEVTVEVAEECSGIRSTLSLFISSILVGYLFLRSGWPRVSFVLLALLISIFKNAVRIVTISWLGVYVDGGFFVGRLHRNGGLVFSAVALILLVPLLFLLARTERRHQKAPADRKAAPVTGPSAS